MREGLQVTAEIVVLVLACINLVNAQATYTITKHFKERLQDMADAKEELAAIAATINAKLDAVKTDIDNLRAQLAGGTLSVADVDAALQPIVDKLTAIEPPAV
jgi:ABC-type protease/lipase transport system fused ATPase/permease subunit